MNLYSFIILDVLEKCLYFTNLGSEECPILLKNYKYGFTLPCNHSFSSEGLINWIESGNFTCPMCRFCIVHRQYH